MNQTHSQHTPVLVETVVQLLTPCLAGLIVDGTAGQGGHTQALLEAGAYHVLAIDIDPNAVLNLRTRFAKNPRVSVAHASYDDFSAQLAPNVTKRTTGTLLDLGVSSNQLDDASRGFSFRLDGAIDMRFNPTVGRPASQLVNRMPEHDLETLLRDLGDERRARAIARRIVARRPLQNTTELASSVASVFPNRGRIHPATRTFQALRIATNDELKTVAQGLNRARHLLKDGGRLVVIAFHSLEDRTVKNTFREWAREGAGQILTRKPVRPEQEESRRNPRSRSARLRAFEMEGQI